MTSLATPQTAPLDKGRDRPAHLIEIRNVSHLYGGSVALDDVSVRIEPGELLALLGPSGCGKTTLLRIIAGFVAQSAGQILVDAKPIDSLDAGRRGIGIVFQNYALFPHLSVLENVAYGPLAQRLGRSRALALSAEMLARVRMGGFERRLPRELSGGQQQRVALARALATSPRILLLDEPFSALDKALRLDMQSEVKSIIKDAGVTSIMVTHDQEEALSMADRIVVMKRGRIEQVGRPMEIYSRPASAFVAGFVGHMNFLAGTLREVSGRTRIRLEGGEEVDCPSAEDIGTGDAVVLSIRPENLEFATDGLLAGRIAQTMPLGPTRMIEVKCEDGQTLRVLQTHGPAGNQGEIGDLVRIAIADLSRCSVFRT